MKLYYSPGTCSLADHIALHDADMKFDLVKVDLKTHKLQDGSLYTDINPKGYVPALQLDDGELLTENIAILSYIADQDPALMPPGQFGRYRLLEMLGYLASELHKAYHPLFDPKASEEEKKKAGAAVEKRLDFIATQFAGPYLFGPHPTVADNYLFVMLRWAAQMKLSIPEKLQAFSEHMRARPTVHIAMKHEGLN